MISLLDQAARGWLLARDVGVATDGSQLDFEVSFVGGLEETAVREDGADEAEGSIVCAVRTA
jgi:hypothetical protein